jgi:hypothetical protein
MTVTDVWTEFRKQEFLNIVGMIASSYTDENDWIKRGKRYENVIETSEITWSIVCA